MKVSAEFVTSAAGPEGWPGDGLPELALVGRSNVGKSTLVNVLCRQKLARTSAAPGKTRLMNLYRVRPGDGSPFYLVDLPGFGYARAPKQRQGSQGSAEDRRRAAREEFEALTREYFDDRSGRTPPRPGRRRPSAFGVLLAVDGRHPGLESDLRAWHWISALDVPAAVVATKIDKLSRAERSRAQRDFDRAFQGPVLPISAVSGEGLNDLWTLIARLLSSTPPAPTARR